MNTDTETKQRFKRRLLNTVNAVDGLAVFIEVNNEAEECAAYRRGRELQDEVRAMADRLQNIFNDVSTRAI